MSTKAYAAPSATEPLGPFAIARRAPGPTDVEIDILFCGVCHSDLHFARNEWGGSVYPIVPGHEVLGRVTRVGAKVTRFKAGDLASVGCLVDSCRTCDHCRRGLEQFCKGGATFTYNGPDKHLGGMTYGGYSEKVVVSSDADAMAKHAGTLDLIVDTVSADHPIDAYLSLLALDGAMVMVGVPPNPQQVHAFSLIMPRRTLAGSLIGGIAETQEMLDFCGTHGVACDIELIRMDQINEAYERMLRSDVKYRFVIDMASLKG